MSPAERIYAMLSLAHSENRNFPATIFYNEGWLLRLVLDWFSRRNSSENHPLDFSLEAGWFSEALLPSQFRPRRRPDPLSESRTHADGVIGHVTIGSGAKADVVLKKGASQFVVIEAKLFSPLAPNVKKAPGFNQAARNVACIAEVLCRAEQHPERIPSIGFFVLAPQVQIEKNIFSPLMDKSSIRDKVTQRVRKYDESDKDQWLNKWFEPTLDRARVETLSWEHIIELIHNEDPTFGSDLSGFYRDCLQFNQIQETRSLNGY
ncbi:MAG TPA: hypothetical protein VKS78_04230 [Roseiarcus sp.]|nr:hypothetical protein [Roseiarcus sp.]